MMHHTSTVSHVNWPDDIEGQGHVISEDRFVLEWPSSKLQISFLKNVYYFYTSQATFQWF